MCDDKTIQHKTVETVADETVCLSEDSNNCFQNNFQNNKNDGGLLEPEEEENIDNSVEYWKLEELMKDISRSNNNNIVYLSSLIQTDEQLFFYTGMNFNVLRKVGQIALAIEYNSDKSVSFQSVKDRIILCLCKLRRNYSFRVLSVLFRMSPKECEDKFYYMIPLLSEILRKVIFWPEKKDVMEETLTFKPQFFSNFLDVRFILHCIEITIKKPQNCFKCSFCTHSLRKGHSTVKFIVAVLPSGLISFVSKAYGGLAPAQAIVNQSKILKRINLKKDAIMVNSDLAVYLKDLEKQVEIVKPYILDDTKTEFTDEEKNFNTDFETCYAQVEGVVEKFTQFKILNSTLSLRMACYIDKIANVIAGIINLQDYNDNSIT